jgi:membrane protease YdiL (CAAX protease family)
MSTTEGAPRRAHEPPKPDSFVYGFWFLLALTVLSTFIGELAFAWTDKVEPRGALGAVFWTEVPPFLCGFLFPYVVIRVVYRSTLASFGVHWFEPGRSVTAWLVGLSAASIAAWIPVWWLVFSAAEMADAGELPFSVAELVALNPLQRMFLHPTDVQVFAVVLHMFVLVGFMEELLGRGLLQNALRRRYTGTLGRGRWSVSHSTFLASVLFAAWHVQWFGSVGEVVQSIGVSLTIVLVPVFALCLLYEKTRSMLAVIVLHNVIDGGKLVFWYIVGSIFVRG